MVSFAAIIAEYAWPMPYSGTNLKTIMPVCSAKTRELPPKTFRMALGALIIKEKLNITDEESVEQIQETLYLQYLIGFNEHQDESPFDPSMMVHFRKRFSPEILAEINEEIIQVNHQRTGAS